MLRIGLISDTHGLLRAEALGFLRGSDHIIHAGDIGRPEVLAGLSALAPLTVVRGNNDHGGWADVIAETQTLHIGDRVIYVLHDIAQLAIDPVARGLQAVISGHSHKPSIGRRGGVLYINPGSAGPRRFKLPVCVGELLVEHGSIDARLMELACGDANSSGTNRAAARRKGGQELEPATQADGGRQR